MVAQRPGLRPTHSCLASLSTARTMAQQNIRENEGMISIKFCADAKLGHLEEERVVNHGPHPVGTVSVRDTYIFEMFLLSTCP